MPGTLARRPLALDNLRCFAAVARTLSFRTAADEQHLTQSAVSRRIQSLERELGRPLFVRDTRTVELTQAGLALLQAVTPTLDRLDRTVTRLRQEGQRRHVSVTTFSSFATLWLLPRLDEFQRTHPDIDIRIVANDKITALDDPDIDVALRYAAAIPVPAHAQRLFGEIVTPVASPMLVSQARAERAPALDSVAALRRHTWFDEDDGHPGSVYSSWRHWLAARGESDASPRRRVTVNYGHQGIQAAIAGQGLAMGRLGLVHQALERGELIEVLGRAGRLRIDAAYWMVPMLSAVLRPELTRFFEWVCAQAGLTRAAMGEDDTAPPKVARSSGRHPRSMSHHR
jgi:LysR family transcriptional regulator, glycine cleavage system transcriptional activator